MLTAETYYRGVNGGFHRFTAKSIGLTSVLLLAFAALCPGQTNGKKETTERPDLTGKWQLDKAKTVDGSRFNSTLVIAHRDPELKILRTDVRKKERIEHEYIYYTDRRGEINPFRYGAGRIGSETKWKGTKIVIYAGGTTIKWQISADARSLTYTESSVVNGELGWTKLVYLRETR